MQGCSRRIQPAQNGGGKDERDEQDDKKTNEESSWVWGSTFTEASTAVSRVVNSHKLEEVRWFEVNIKAMLPKSGRESACSEEEDEDETRASIKGARKGRMGEEGGSSNSTSCSLKLLVPSLIPPQTARSTTALVNSEKYLLWMIRR